MDGFLRYDKSLGFCFENEKLLMGFKLGCDIRFLFYKDN